MGFQMFETALGPCGIAWSDMGVTCIQLPEATPEATRKRLLEKAREAARDRDAEPGPETNAPPAWVEGTITRIRAHLAGDTQELGSIRLDMSQTTPFLSRVYRALQRVRAGTTTTYGELARAAGSPGAARAIGRAMA